MKTIVAAAIFALVPAIAFAGGKDPSPERDDPVSTKEEVLGNCLKDSGFTWVESVKEYEQIRYSKPNHFYFGTKIWISRNSDLAKAKPCLDKIGAK